MKRLTWLLWAAVMLAGAEVVCARESERARANSVLLNGLWEYVFGDGSEGAETTAGQAKLQWKRVMLPGPFMRWNQEVANQTKFLWARRSFNVSAAKAKGLAVLRWNRIANGAEAFINGRKVGENQIVLKIRGAAGVRRSRSGNALIPAGFGVGMPEVTDDVCAKTTGMALVPAASGGGRILFHESALSFARDSQSSSNLLRNECESVSKPPPHRPLAPPRAESRGRVDSGSGLAAAG